jgi:hypothetical protein
MSTVRWRGGWSGSGSPLTSLITYYNGDVVLYENITYAVQQNISSIVVGSSTPPNDMSNWDVLVAGGSDGTSGSSGISGTSGYAGSSGSSGSSGTTGINGISGTSGTTNLGYYLTSTSSVTIGDDNPAFTTNISGDGNGLVIGQLIRVYDSTNPSNYIQGKILILIGDLLQITDESTGGSGTHDSWIISSFGISGLDGSSGTSGVSGSNGSNGTSGVSAVPGWTSAGTINSVGWIATTTNPTIGLAEWDNLSYRQLGSKEWEIVMSFNNTGNGGGAANAGNGDYLFKLPNSLSFDTTLAWQKICTFSVLTSDPNLGKFIIPSGTGMMTDGGGSTTTNLTPIIWNSNYFRILAYIPGSAIKCMGSNYFHTTSTVGFSLNFTFTST